MAHFGALMNDKTLYNKLNDAILSAEILIDDLRTHPKRYVNLSIFGKKDKNRAINFACEKRYCRGSELMRSFLLFFGLVLTGALLFLLE